MYKRELDGLVYAPNKKGSLLNDIHVGSESHEIITHLLSDSVLY